MAAFVYTGQLKRLLHRVFGALGQFNENGVSLSDGDLALLQLDKDGNLKVTGGGGPAMDGGLFVVKAQAGPAPGIYNSTFQIPANSLIFACAVLVADPPYNDAATITVNVGGGPNVMDPGDANALVSGLYLKPMILQTPNDGQVVVTIGGVPNQGGADVYVFFVQKILT